MVIQYLFLVTIICVYCNNSFVLGIVLKVILQGVVDVNFVYVIKVMLWVSL